MRKLVTALVAVTAIGAGLLVPAAPASAAVATVTTVDASANPSKPGQRVQLIARVLSVTLPRQAPDGGTVSFSRDGTLIGLVPIDAAGVARLIVEDLPVSGDFGTNTPYEITAHYGGTVAYAPSDGVHKHWAYSYIDEDLPFTEQYTGNAYVDLLARIPDSGGLTYWSQQMAINGLPRSYFAIALGYSIESSNLLVNAAYNRILGRAADPSGLSYYSNWLSGVGKPALRVEFLHAALLVSSEFFSTHSTSDAWIDGAYRAVLERPVDPSGLQWMKDMLAGGASYFGLALLLEYSTEHINLVIDDFYKSYLQRSVDPSGLSFWRSYILAGVPQQFVMGYLVGSDEYFGYATNDFPA